MQVQPDNIPPVPPGPAQQVVLQPQVVYPAQGKRVISEQNIHL